MDCNGFNDCITEYEAKRLTKKQETEFLQHKNCCEECGQVFDLVFGCDFSDIEEYNLNYDDGISISVMDKIQDIECNSYNIKLENILHIVFAGLLVTLGLFVLFTFEKGLHLFNNRLSKISTFSDNLCNGVDSASQNFVNIYIHSVIYIFAFVLIVSFVVTIIESVNQKIHEGKKKNQN